MPKKSAPLVLAKVADVDLVAAKVERFQWVEVAPEQARAYYAGRPDWRSVDVKPPAWPVRLWRRLRG